MKKIFLVMTDPEKGAREDNWTVMNAYEFALFLQTEEGRKRSGSFEMLEAAGEEDDILYMECGHEKAYGLKSERNRAGYRRSLEKELGVKVLPLDAACDDAENGETFLDMLADEDMDTEEMAMTGILKAELPAALGELDPEELDLVLELYCGDREGTVNSYAKNHGLTRWSVRQLHKAALRKLRMHYRKKRLM